MHADFFFNPFELVLFVSTMEYMTMTYEILHCKGVKVAELNI